jgi:hypothetical protein
MSRLNLDPLLTFPDGSHLVISTQHSAGEEFSCALYSAVVGNDDRIAFKVVSHDIAASSCMKAQESAYEYALRRYRSAGVILKKPPYLIWHGPRSSEMQ